MAENGIELEDLAAYEWTGSHHNCANEVMGGRFDAGGMQDTLSWELEKAGLIRIIYTSEYFPSSGIVANRNVPAGQREKVKQALLDFKPKERHSEGLYHWEKTEMPNGFIPAQDKDYEILRKWGRKFGLFDEQNQPPPLNGVVVDSGAVWPTHERSHNPIL